MRWLVALFLSPIFASAQESRPVTKFGGDFIQHLSWSPDGKSFLFSRIHKGKLGLWTIAVDGSSPHQLFPKETNPTFDGGWATDGGRVIFVYDTLQGTDGKLQIDTAAPDGSDRKNLLPHAAFDESPRWSPDGKSIAFTSTRNKNQDIWIMDAQGKNFSTTSLTSNRCLFFRSRSMRQYDPLPDNLPDALHQIELLRDELERVTQDRDFYGTAWRSEINAKFGVKEIPWDEINDILAGREKGANNRGIAGGAKGKIGR